MCNIAVRIESYTKYGAKTSVKTLAFKANQRKQCNFIQNDGQKYTLFLLKVRMTMIHTS